MVGVYKYVCTPRIHANGEQWIQMGCHLRTREDWEKDFWNNPQEFPNNGDKASAKRLLAFKLAIQWLDAQTVAKGEKK